MNIRNFIYQTLVFYGDTINSFIILCIFIKYYSIYKIFSLTFLFNSNFFSISKNVKETKLGFIT